MPQPIGWLSTINLTAAQSPSGSPAALTWSADISGSAHSSAGPGYVSDIDFNYALAPIPLVTKIAIAPTTSGIADIGTIQSGWALFAIEPTDGLTMQAAYSIAPVPISFVPGDPGNAGTGGGHSEFAAFQPLPIVVAPNSSMILALADAVAAYLYALNILNAFGVLLNITREYVPIPSLISIKPTDAPRIQIFAISDSETRGGLNQASFKGDYEIAIAVLGFAGASATPGFKATCDFLMNLRQMIRNSLRGQGAIIANGAVSAIALVEEINSNSSYEQDFLMKSQVFVSQSHFKFSLNV